MKKKSTVHLSAAVLAAFLAWPANAEDSAPAPAKAPDPTAAASAVPAVAPAAGAERPRIEPRLADTPEEKEHARRMAAIATLRDTKTQEAEEAAREAAFSQQKNLNTEIAEAMRRRMGERRADTPEERAKRGPVPAPRSTAERIRLPGPPPEKPAEPEARAPAGE